MGTIADKLELLRRTKERQREYLQKKYPLLDFDNIPFRAYLDLFQGRSYVPGFVLGVKAYGRSNNEDASTRDILPDYSGNGRDIKLYNFAFAGNSGYNGFVENTYLGETWSDINECTDVAYSNDKTKAEVSQLKQANVIWVFIKSISSDPVGTKYKLKARIQGLSDYISLGKSIRVNLGDTRNDGLNGITEDGVYETEFVKTETSYSFIGLSISVPGEEDLGACSMTFEQIPDYPGALVSDGVDDYGQCIKDFALPDDYTVVAIRKLLNNSRGNAGLVSKSKNTGKGAFIFEYTNSGSVCYSYGERIANSNVPALFSYLTKTSFNGMIGTPGTAEDGPEDKLMLFHEEYTSIKNAALYDLRIYDHSLTAEELQTVKDEMMADYEKATGGGMADVTYVADWDAKGRSNDEEETMRSQWIDKVNGRVINLNNYSFSEMSGWGGFRFDWSGWASDINSNGGEVIREKDKVTVKNFGENPTWTIINRSASALGGTLPAFSVRVSGLKEGAALQFNASGKSTLLLVHSDGIYSIPEDSSNPTFYSFVAIGYSANEAANLVIEQLPVYPGALVSDGVDDYIKADEALGEVGSVLIHWKDVGLKSGYYLYNTGWDDDDAGRLYFYREGQGSVSIMAGIPSQVMNRNPIQIFHRSPLVSTGLLNNSAGKNNCPIFRLIFIKEQLDEYQQEFLKWKVEKEYRDWCKANGYEYAINEMLNN